MNELEWVFNWVEQLEAALKDVLFSDESGGWMERTGYNWTYPADGWPQRSTYTYKSKRFEISTGHGNVIFEISLFGEGEPAESIVVDISQVIGSVRQECNYCKDDNIHIIISKTIRFMVSEFARNGRERYYVRDDVMSRKFNSPFWKVEQIVGEPNE